MISDIDRQNFIKAWQRILSADRVLLVSHINPDVDALSSLGVFIEIFKSMDKDFLALAEKKTDDYYFLPGFEDIVSSKDELLSLIKLKYNQGQELGDDWLKFFDIVITLDCGSLDRTFLAEEIKNIKDLMLNTRVIEIDHHVKVSSYADVEIKIQLSSNTELLYYFLKENKVEIDRDVANCILAGMLTDTGNFLYSSVSDKTLKIASEMMSLGAQFPKLLQNTWRNKNFWEMKLWGMALANLKINKKYNIAFSVLTYDNLHFFKESTNALGSDVFGDIVGFMSSLSDAKTFLLLREEERGKIKGSLRVGSGENVEKIDVAYLASFLGGGGHKKAAGFMINGSIIKNKDLYTIK